jgi:hypothetical protein
MGNPFAGRQELLYGLKFSRFENHREPIGEFSAQIGLKEL